MCQCDNMPMKKLKQRQRWRKSKVKSLRTQVSCQLSTHFQSRKLSGQIFNLSEPETGNPEPETRTNGHRPKGVKPETRNNGYREINPRLRSSLRNQAAFFMFGCVDNRKMHPQNIFRLSSNQIKTMSCSSYLPHVGFKILPKGCWQSNWKNKGVGRHRC